MAGDAPAADDIQLARADIPVAVDFDGGPAFRVDHRCSGNLDLCIPGNVQSFLARGIEQQKCRLIRAEESPFLQGFDEKREVRFATFLEWLPTFTEIAHAL